MRMDENIESLSGSWNIILLNVWVTAYSNLYMLLHLLLLIDTHIIFMRVWFIYWEGVPFLLQKISSYHNFLNTYSSDRDQSQHMR